MSIPYKKLNYGSRFFLKKNGTIKKMLLALGR